MPRAFLRLVVAAALFASAPELVAQTVPLPVLPEAPAPTPTPTPTPEPAPEPQPTPSPKPPRKAPAEPPAEETARARPWDYAVGMGVAWDSNTDFLVPDGQSNTAIVPGGRISRLLSSTHGQLRAEAAGRWSRYPSQDTANRSYFDGGLRGDYRSSPRTRWRGDVHYWLGYTDSSPTLIEQGVPLPLGETSTFSGEFEVSHLLGGRTSVRAEGRILTSDFADPDFIDGRSIRGTVTLGRQLGGRDGAAVAYALESALAADAGESYPTHFGSLQWSHVLSRRSAFLLEAGASLTREAMRVDSGRSHGFFGGVTFLRQIGRSNVTAFARRELTPAFGLGVSRQESRLGLRAELPLGRNWTLNADAFHIQPTASEGGDQVYPSSTDVAAALDRRLGRHFSVSGEARYRRRGETVAQPMVSSFQFGLFVALVSPRR
jgi:hypothetical protein